MMRVCNLSKYRRVRRWNGQGGARRRRSWMVSKPQVVQRCAGDCRLRPESSDKGGVIYRSGRRCCTFAPQFFSHSALNSFSRALPVSLARQTKLPGVMLRLSPNYLRSIISQPFILRVRPWLDSLGWCGAFPALIFHLKEKE